MSLKSRSIGLLIVLAIILFCMQPAASETTASETQVTPVSPAAFDRFGSSVSMSNEIATEHYLAVGSPEAAATSGSVYIFTGSGTSWSQQQRLWLSGQTAKYFGTSVSIDRANALHVCIGSPESASSTGSAYIYGNSGGVWTQVTSLTSGGLANGDFYGNAVAIDYSNTAIVGSFKHDIGGTIECGAAYIFYRNEGGADNWGLKATLDASDRAQWDEFGTSVALDYAYGAELAVVGSPKDDHGASSNAGSAYIFDRHFTGMDAWGELKKLTASDADANDNFGSSVAIEGDFVAVGAPGNDDDGTNSGAVYLFGKNIGGANNWGQQVKLVAGDGSSQALFGSSVSLDLPYLIVGASYDNQTGASYVFQYDGISSWVQIAKLTASNAGNSDDLGESVSMSYPHCLVGAPENDDNGSDAGMAYVYDLTASTDEAKIVDQYQNCWEGSQFLPNWEPGIAQSFVPSVHVLDAVKIMLVAEQHPDTYTNIKVMVFDQLPVGAVTPIASSIWAVDPPAPGGYPEWFQVHFASTVSLIPGQTYYIAVSELTYTDNVRWMYCEGDHYVNGIGYVSTGPSELVESSPEHDYAFRTEYYGLSKLVDQYQELWVTDVYLPQWTPGHAQSFMPAVDVLDAVKILLDADLPIPTTVEVRLYTHFPGGGAPYLASTTMTILPPQHVLGSPMWFQFHFDETIEVVPDQTYYITAFEHTFDNNVHWYMSFEDPVDNYVRGTGYMNISPEVLVYPPDQSEPACDFAFKTEYFGIICGDANNSGAIDIDDVVFLISYIFGGGPAPIPLVCVGDANESGNVDIDDVVFLIQYIFGGGPAPGENCCP